MECWYLNFNFNFFSLYFNLFPEVEETTEVETIYGTAVFIQSLNFEITEFFVSPNTKKLYLGYY